MNCIQIENLNRRFSNFALENVSFSVPAGSVMGFIGENGAGKTTTLKLILNLIKRDSGQINIFGLDNIKDEKKIKEQIGVVFDDCCFHDSLMCSDISRVMGRIYKNWDAPAFMSYLKKFSLPQNKTVKEFSRGMKMKLSIGAALAHHPKLLILDEATSGLDPIVRDEILEMFFDFIQDENHTILLSSHITSDLEKIADYITFIHQGKIIFSSCKDDIIETHGILKCSSSDLERVDKTNIISVRKNQFGTEALIKDKVKVEQKFPNCVIDHVSLEDIMLFYVKGEQL